MTELEAINMLLRLIGCSPVNNPENGHPDVANARATLNRIRGKLQRRGWWFNIDYNVTYQPDENREIRIPIEITSLVAENPNYVTRGRKLYNKLDNTFKFDCNVLAKRVIRELDWDDLPATMQEYIADFAAHEFIRDELEDQGKQNDLKESASVSLLNVKKQDLEEGRYNTFNKSRVIQARAGVQPYHRNNRRFTGDPDV